MCISSSFAFASLLTSISIQICSHMNRLIAIHMMQQLRQPDGGEEEEEARRQQYKLGRMLHIYELFMHIKKFSKRSNQKLEITVAGPVPVSPPPSTSHPLPLPTALGSLTCTANLQKRERKKNIYILVLLFNKRIPAQVKVFSPRFFFVILIYILCVALSPPPRTTLPPLHTPIV